MENVRSRRGAGDAATPNDRSRGLLPERPEGTKLGIRRRPNGFARSAPCSRRVRRQGREQVAETERRRRPPCRAYPPLPKPARSSLSPALIRRPPTQPEILTG